MTTQAYDSGKKRPPAVSHTRQARENKQRQQESGRAGGKIAPRELARQAEVLIQRQVRAQEQASGNSNSSTNPTPSTSTSTQTNTRQHKVKPIKEFPFKGENSPLSNLFKLKTPIHFKKLYFFSTEVLYQWHKAISHQEFEKAKKIINSTPRNAMTIGKTIKTGSYWNNNKADFMRFACAEKAKVSREYRDALLATTNQILVENTCHPFWGRGKDNKGENNLGVIHCEIRDELFQKLRQ